MENIGCCLTGLSGSWVRWADSALAVQPVPEEAQDEIQDEVQVDTQSDEQDDLHEDYWDDKIVGSADTAFDFTGDPAQAAHEEWGAVG